MRWDEARDSGGQRIARFAIRLLITAAAVWVASHIVTGITPLNQVSSVLLVAVILGVVNALVKPLFQFLTCPLQLLTLGLFTFVINAAMLGLTSWIAGQLSIPFQVDGFIAALLGAVVISVVSWALSSLI